MEEPTDYLLICPMCKSTTSYKQLLEDMEWGSNGMCDCQYMAFDTDGEPVYTREYIQYVPLQEYVKNLEGDIVRREDVKSLMSKDHHWVFVELLEFPEGDDALLAKMEAAVGCFMSELQSAICYKRGFLSEQDAKSYKKSLETEDFENYLYVDYYFDRQLKEL